MYVRRVDLYLTKNHSSDIYILAILIICVIFHLLCDTLVETVTSLFRLIVVLYVGVVTSILALLFSNIIDIYLSFI